jgi:hypothetical protein
MDYPFLVNGGKPCDDEKDTQSVLFRARETQGERPWQGRACRAADQCAVNAAGCSGAKAPGKRK